MSENTNSQVSMANRITDRPHIIRVDYLTRRSKSYLCKVAEIYERSKIVLVHRHSSTSVIFEKLIRTRLETQLGTKSINNCRLQC